MSFVHLHTHSAYSLSEGAIKADKLAALAAADGMPALALTDTGNLFGALEFVEACTKKGVQPIMGCQLGLSRSSTDADRPDAQRLTPDPLVALALTPRGLDNLQRLSSLGFLREDASGKAAITLEQLAEHAEGLFLLTGGTLGPISRLLLEGQKPAAERLLARLKEAFPDRLAVELNRHGRNEEARLEPALLALAHTARLPIIAANDVYFAAPAMYEAHDALL